MARRQVRLPLSDWGAAESARGRQDLLRGHSEAGTSGRSLPSSQSQRLREPTDGLEKAPPGQATGAGPSRPRAHSCPEAHAGLSLLPRRLISASLSLLIPSNIKLLIVFYFSNDSHCDYLVSAGLTLIITWTFQVRCYFTLE